LSTPFAARQRF